MTPTRQQTGILALKNALAHMTGTDHAATSRDARYFGDTLAHPLKMALAGLLMGCAFTGAGPAVAQSAEAQAPQEQASQAPSAEAALTTPARAAAPTEAPATSAGPASAPDAFTSALNSAAPASSSAEGEKDGASKSSFEPAPLAEWIQDKITAPPLKKSRGYATFEEDVRRIVRERHKAVQKCYRRELKEDPQQTGELLLKFVVQESGRVEAVTVDFSSLSSPAMEPCVLKAFEQLSFPTPPKAGYRVLMPLVFTSQRTPVEVVDALKHRYQLEDPVQASKPQKPATKADQDPW